MDSFSQFQKNKDNKKEKKIEIKMVIKDKKRKLKDHELKGEIKSFPNIIEKEKSKGEIDINQFKKERERKKGKKRKKKKYLSVNIRYKVKKSIDNIKKELIISKNKLNKSLSIFRTKKAVNNSISNISNKKVIQRIKPMLKSQGVFKINEDKKIDNSTKYGNLTFDKIGIYNYDKKSYENKKNKINNKLILDKPKITINEVLNEISSMNGEHTNNFTSKYLKETSKNNNALNGIIVNDSMINVNIRTEKISISASVNKQISNKNDDNINNKNDLIMDKKINTNLNKSNNNRIKLYINEKRKRKEEFEERYIRIRKEYKDKEYEQSIENMKSYIYLILPGNASYLIKNCMCHRINWREPFSMTTSLYNFKWQQLSLGIDYNSLGKIANIKQIVNHFENHFALTNKANMFINLMEYCEKRKISIFKYVPFTIIFQLRDKTNYTNNSEIVKSETKRMEELKNFIKNYQNYIVNYNDIGKFYEDEKYKNEINKRYEKKKIKNIKEKEKEKKEEIDDKIDINQENDIKLYKDYFDNLKLVERIQKIKKDKKGNYYHVEEEINENIGNNTMIEISDTHCSGHNLWIIKAINLNRGQCIKLVNSFEQIEEIIQKFKEGVKYDFTREDSENKTQDIILNNINNDIKDTEEDEKNNNKDKLYYCSRIIIQKYIEKPLLYKNRKCDIRIWVLLTQSMKVYVFKEGHLKACSEEYKLNSKNPYIHITNYSFQKYNNNFQKFEKGNEIPFYEFQKFINEAYPEKNYKLNVDLMNKIKKIISLTMRSVKDKINKNERTHQFEIFGYDFMLDENFNAFLIEINTNPGLEESSPWIKTIVPRMLDDALRLTLDQLFEPKYDFNLNYKKTENIENILNRIKNDSNGKSNIKNNKKYISPFPVPGYDLNDNLWDLVCDLNEIDPYDIKIDDKNKTYSGIRHLLLSKNKLE